jgi:hypothetical protein
MICWSTGSPVRESRDSPGAMGLALPRKKSRQIATVVPYTNYWPHELARIRRTRSGLLTADDLWESALKLIYGKLPAHVSTDRFIEVGE